MLFIRAGSVMASIISRRTDASVNTALDYLPASYQFVSTHTVDDNTYPVQNSYYLDLLSLSITYIYIFLLPD